MTKGYIPEAHLRGPMSPTLVGGWFNSNPWSKVRYVNSAHRNASDTKRSGEDYEHPLATVAQALADITTKGYEDALVIVGPEHVETISSILTISKQGTQVVGLGHGDRRPTFTLDTATTVVVSVTATGVKLHNLRFEAGIDAIDQLVAVSAASALISDCTFEGDASYQVDAALAFAAGADKAKILGCSFLQATAGGASSIHIVGASDSVEIAGCWGVGDYSAANISNTVAAATNLSIHHNRFENLNAVDVNIDMIGTATGFIHDNVLRIATDGELTWIDTFDGQLAANWGINNDGETGKLIGTASA